MFFRREPSLASRRGPLSKAIRSSYTGLDFGLTTPNIPAGQIVQTSNSPMLPLTVYVGSETATVAYAGLAADAVGLYQFNVVVPAIPLGVSTAVITFDLGAAGLLRAAAQLVVQLPRNVDPCTHPHDMSMACLLSLADCRICPQPLAIGTLRHSGPILVSRELHL
jgi:hypothetical protein